MTLLWTRPLNRSDYQEYLLGGKDGRCVGLTLLSSCADCLESLSHLEPSGPVQDCTGIVLSFRFTVNKIIMTQDNVNGNRIQFTIHHGRSCDF